jgi:hypothetical protein
MVFLMSSRLAPVLSLFALLAVAPAAAQQASPAPPLPQPSLVPPPVPDAATLAALPPYELARGYLAAVAAVPLAQAAGEGQGILNLGIDGQPYIVNTANAARFIPFLQARVAAYGKAITTRGSAKIDGTYGLAAGPACKGEKFDPRILFAGGKGPDGTPLMATSARVIQMGAETDLLVTLVQGRQSLGEIIMGTAVENTLVLADVMSHGFSIYGTISGNTIELRLDPEEVKDAIGADTATAADWKLLEACVFTLTKK